MLPRKFRYNLKERFIPENSQASEHFIFKIKKNNSDNTRFAIVVSKKTERTSVGRNRMRRIIFDLVYKDISHFKPNYDILIIIKRSIIGVDIKNELFSSLRKLDIND